MSRCFPFPPPGYEPKASTGIIDLLTKEKQREKKHKKEKREHREKRDNDRIKDKRKEKDKKHKDWKKENDRNKGRTSEDIKAEGLAQDQNEDSKFEEELGKRTRDDWTENPMVGNFTNSIKEKFEGLDAASASLEKERVAASRMFSVQVASVQRKNDSSGLPIENVAISQRRVECTSTATAMEKERRNKMHGCVTSATVLEKETVKMCEKVACGRRRSTDESRKNGIFRSIESVSGLFIRKTEGSTTGMKMEKCGERSLVSNSVAFGVERGKHGTKVLALSSLAAAQRRKDVLGVSFENLSSIDGKTEVVGTPSLYSRIEGVDYVLTIEKERVAGGEQFQVGQAVEKNTTKKVAEDRKGHKDGDHSVKKSKAKEQNRLTKEKKKEENIVENAEDIEHNKLRNIGKKVQADTLNRKPLAPHKDNSSGTVCVEGTTKKRKYLDTNGFLQENDERPNKIPRTISFSQSLVNGRSLELHHTAPCSILLKSGAINNLRPDRLLENNEIKINGNALSQLSPLELKPPISAGLTKNSDASYLSQIYSVPKMAELPEIDDQDWLFHCYDSLEMSKIDLKAKKIPQVFAEARRIESADVLALPYVIPF